jgi:hypothetical protein
VTRVRTGAAIAGLAAIGALGVCRYAGMPGATPPAATSAPEVRATPPAASIEDRVRVWAASANPADWLQAFQAIETCLRLERDKELVDTEVKVTKQGPDAGVELVSHKADDVTVAGLRQSCAPMTGRTRLDRYQLLERAVDGHAGGALALYIAQGPQGDRDALHERPADPLVAAWREGALRRLQDGISRGYPDALMTAPTGYALLDQAQEPVDVYMQQLATNKITAAINHDEGFYPQTMLDAAAGALGPQQRHDATLAAQRIFTAWQARRR